MARLPTNWWSLLCETPLNAICLDVCWREKKGLTSPTPSRNCELAKSCKKGNVGRKKFNLASLFAHYSSRKKLSSPLRHLHFFLHTQLILIRDRGGGEGGWRQRGGFAKAIFAPESFLRAPTIPQRFSATLCFLPGLFSLMGDITMKE